jgi:hypothetical protein
MYSLRVCRPQRNISGCTAAVALKRHYEVTVSQNVHAITLKRY